MKRLFAVLLIAALAFSFAACGAKTPAEPTTEATTEEITTDPAVTEPEVGRIGEKSAFYVYIPEKWCKMEYTGDSMRLRLFDIPSAPKIEEGKTDEVEIKVAAEAGKQADVDAAVADLLKIKGAEKSKETQKIGDGDFTVVTYTDANEKRVYTTYVGLGGGTLATIALKGISPQDEDAAAILRSITFKPVGKRTEPTTTTRPATTAAAKTTKAADEKTTKAAEKTTAAAKTTKAADEKTTKAAEKTTAAAKTTKAAEKTTAAAKTTKAAEKTTAAAKTTKAAEKTTAAAKTTKAAPKTTKAAG